MTCTDNTGPPAPQSGSIAVIPNFGVLQGGIVEVARGRFLLTRVPGGEVARDTIIDIPAEADSVDLSLTVPLLAPGETFNLTITLISSAGDTVFRGGPVVVTPGTSGTPVPVAVPFSYTGTGANAAAVQILTPDTTTLTGDTILVMGQALDSGAVAIPGTPVGWTSLDTAVVSVATDPQYRGVAVGGAQRGVARIVAALVTGQMDTVLVSNQPLPSSIVAESGTGQSARADSTLAQPLVARVTAGDGLGVQGQWVRFAVTSGTGALSADSVLTDSAGRAPVQFTMARSFQPHMIEATTPRLGAVAATFSATLIFEPPDTLEIVAGDGQTAVAGSAVSVAPQVRVLDADGLPVPGVTVTFAATGGGGSVAGGTPVTDTLGLAAVTAWTLGPMAGANTVTATVDGLTATFTATGVAGPATQLVLVNGDAQTDTAGATLPLPLVVRAEDANANPVAGATVDWVAGAGNVSAPSTVTDAAGLAQVNWTLGSAAGVQSATATLGGTSATVGFSAAATPGTASILAFTVEPTDVREDSVITPAVTVTAYDGFGNVAAGFTGTVQLALLTNPGSATLGGTPAVAAVTGIATFADLSLNAFGTGYALEATAAGLVPDTSAPFDVLPPVGRAYWINAAGGTWSNGANWLGGAPPGPTDTAFIEMDGTYTVTLDADVTIGSIAIGGSSGTATLDANGQTLTVGGGVQVAPDAALIVDGSTLNGSVDVLGTLRLDAGTITGLVTVSPGAAFAAGGTGATVGGGVTNYGTLTVEAFGGAQANLTVTGTLTNMVAAQLTQVDPGTLAAELVNGGVMTVAAALTLGQPDAAHLNTGAITLAGGDLTVSQSGTGPSFTSSGTITVGTGRTFAVSGGTFAHTATGVLNGQGTVDLTGTSVTALDGSAAPGTSPGMLTLALPAGVSLGTNAVVNVELGADPAANPPGVDNDLLDVTGSLLTLGGTLNVSLLGGYVPAGTETWPLLAGVTGSFALVNLPPLDLPWTTYLQGDTLYLGPPSTDPPNLNAWTGGAGDGLWTSVGNWSAGAAPVATDSVVIDLAGAYTITIPTAQAVNAAQLLLGSPGAAPTLVLADYAQLTVADTGSVRAGATLQLGQYARLTGAGTVSVEGTLTCTAGRCYLSGTGLTEIAPGGTFVIDATGGDGLSLETRSLINRGTTNWQGASSISASGGATVLNAVGGVFNVSTSASLAAPFVNEGTFTRAGNSFATTFAGPFTTTGTVDVQEGVLSIIEPSAWAGTVGITPGTGQIDLAARAHTFNDGLAVTGPLQVSSPTPFPTSVTVPSAASVTLDQLAFVGGTLQVDGVVDVNGLFTKGAAAVLQGTGTLDLADPVIPAFDGPVNPGTSPGLLTIVTPAGGLLLEPSGSVNIELAGTAPGTQHDVLAMVGGLVLDGNAALNVDTSGFAPALGDRFAVLTFTSRSGAFGSITYPSVAGVSFDTLWTTGQTPDTLYLTTSLGTCGGTPNSFPVVTVSLTNYCSAPDIVGTVAEALDLVQPGGTVQFESGAGSFPFPVAVAKPVTFQSADAGSPVIVGDVVVNGVASGTVTFTGLTFQDAGYGSVQATGTYDQVVVESSTFIVSGTAGVVGSASTVGGALVTVQDNSFSFTGSGSMAVFGTNAGAVINALNNTITGPSTWGGIQFQGGSTGRIEGNVATQCGVVGCINVRANAVGVVVTGNSVSSTPGIGTVRGIDLALTGSTGASVTANTVSGGFTGGDPTDPASYGYAGEAIRLTGTGDGSQTIAGNTLSGAVMGISGGATGALLAGQDNVISTVLTGVGGNTALPMINNDVTNYVNPFQLGIPNGTLTCHWWGSAAGPQNVPGGADPAVYSPWATGPVAQGGGGLCNGGAANSWTGAGDGTSWSDAANWSKNAVPVSTDSVVIALAGATVTLDASPTVDFLIIGGAGGSPTLTQSTNTLTVTTLMHVMTAGVYAFGGGTFTGTGDLTVDGTLTWAGGALGGSGTAMLTAASSLTMETAAQKVLDRDLTLDGVLTHTAGDFAAAATGAVTFTIGPTGQFLMAGDLTVSPGNPGLTVINNGLFAKTAGPGTGVLNASGGLFAFMNNDSVHVASGTLVLANAPTTSTHSGSVIAGPGAVFQVAGGTHTFDGPLGGGGAFRFVGGASTVNGSYGSGDMVVSNASVTFGSTATFPVPVDSIAVDAGPLILDVATLSVPRWRVNGTVTGLADFVVTDSLDWQGGILSGAGTLTILDTVPVTLTTSAVKELDRDATLDGILTHEGGNLGAAATGPVTLTIGPTGQFLMAGDLALSPSANGLTIVNNGLFAKTAGPGTGVLNASGGLLTFTNNGLVDGQTGLLNIASGLTNNDTLEVDAGAVLDIEGTITHAVGALMRGAGTFDLTDATITAFDGAVSPGVSPGILNVTAPPGGLTQAAASAFTIELEGTAPGTGYDRLNFSGDVTLNGTLVVTRTFTPALGDRFAIMTFANRTGQFSSVTLPPVDGLVLDTLWAIDADPIDTLYLVANAAAPPGPPGTEAAWLGTVSADWADPQNWYGGNVPDDTMTVFVQAGTPFAPAVSTTGQAQTLVLDAGATLTVAGTLDVFGDLDAGLTSIAGAGTVNLVGDTGTVSGVVPNLGVNGAYSLVGDLTVNGDLQIDGGDSVGADPGTHLSLQGNTVTVTGDFGTSFFGQVQMRNPADTLAVAGNVTFAGDEHVDDLTAGVLLVGGDFTQLGTIRSASFHPTGSHKTVLNGSGVQTVSLQNTASRLSTFANLEITNAAGVTFASEIVAIGAMTVATPIAIAPPTRLIVDGPIAFDAAASLTAPYLEFGGSLGVTAGSFAVDTVVVAGTALPDSLPYATVIVGAGGALVGPTTVDGNLLVQSIFNVSGQTLVVNGDLLVAGGQAARLVMQSPVDSLVVTGNAVFNGAASAADLTAGVLDLRGDFTQTGTVGPSGGGDNFVAGGTHRTRFSGTVGQTITFSHPDSSVFNDLLITNTAAPVVMASDVGAAGDVSAPSGTALQGGGFGLSAFGDVTVDGLLFLDGLGIFGTLNANPVTFSVATTVFGGSAFEIPDSLPYADVVVSSVVGFMGNTGIGGTLAVTGDPDGGDAELTLGPHTVQAADLLVQGGALLVMSDPDGVLDVAGAAVFDGAASASQLTAGTLQIGGDFTQLATTDAGSFAAEPGHLTVFDGAGPQTITFGTPGLGTSRFGDLQILNTADVVSLASDGLAAGSVTVNADATLALGVSTFQAAGTSVSNDGTIDVGAGTLDVDGTFTHAAGAVLGGSGTLDLADATVVGFDGAVNPGTSPGILAITTPAGGLAPAASSTVTIEIGGPAAGTEHDRLSLSGGVTLDGSMAVSLIDAFTPIAADSFEVLTFGSRSGDFASVAPLDLGGGLVLDTAWSGTALSLLARRTVSTDGSPVDLATSATTDRVYALVAEGQAGTSIVAFDASTDMAVDTIPLGIGRNPYALGVNTTTDKLYVSDFFGTLFIVDGVGGALTDSLPINQPGFTTVDEANNLVYLPATVQYLVPCEPQVCAFPVPALLKVDGAADTIFTADTVHVGASNDQAFGAVFNPNDGFVYVAVYEAPGYVKIVDPATNALVDSMLVADDPFAMALNPVTNRLYVTSDADLSVTVVDLDTRSVITSVPIGGYLPNLSVDPVLDRVHVPNYDNSTVVILDGATGAVLKTVPAGGASDGAYDAVLSPAAPALYIARYAADALTVTRR